MTMRMMPPADGLHPTITVNGRQYTCALGSSVDATDDDGEIMRANGWTGGTCGATAARPATPRLNQAFLDTTLGKIIRWDGKAWRDPNNGSAA